MSTAIAEYGHPRYRKKQKRRVRRSLRGRLRRAWNSPEIKYLRKRSFRWTRLKGNECWAYVVPLPVFNFTVLWYEPGDGLSAHADDVAPHAPFHVGTHVRVNYVWREATEGGLFWVEDPHWHRQLTDRLSVLGASETLHGVTTVAAGHRVVLSAGGVVLFPLDKLLDHPTWGVFR